MSACIGSKGSKSKKASFKFSKLCQNKFDLFLSIGVLIDATNDQIFTFQIHDFYKNGLKFFVFVYHEVEAFSILIRSFTPKILNLHYVQGVSSFSCPKFTQLCTFLFMPFICCTFLKYVLVIPIMLNLQSFQLKKYVSYQN